jgi:hypothetical protein
MHTVIRVVYWKQIIIPLPPREWVGKESKTLDGRR